jgi:thioredoxin reductase (NADPH)
LGLDVRLLDRDGRPGGLVRNAYRIENYPGLDPMDGIAFAARLGEQLARCGIEIEPKRVTRIRAAETGRSSRPGWHLEISAANGPNVTLEATAVILGVGTRACPLGIPGEAEQVGRTVFYEVRELLRRLPKPRAVIVVGGGEAALDYALTLASVEATVRVVMRAERPRAAVRLREAVAARRTIELRPGVLPEHIHPTSSGMRLDCRVADDRRGTAVNLAADAVLVAVGRESRMDEIESGLRFANGAETVSESMGRCVIGDARRGCLGQAGIAVGDGLAAAMRVAEGLARGTTPPGVRDGGAMMARFP